MKIAQITCAWPPYASGVSIVASEQVKRLVAAGHEVTVFTPAYHGQTPGKDNWQGARVEYLQPRYYFGNAAYLPELERKLADFDIIHLHLYFIGSTSGILRAVKRFSKPLVVQYHNDLIGWGWRKLLFRLYTKLVLPKITKAADRVLILSSAHAASSDLAAFGSMRKKWMELPNGVDVTKYFPQTIDLLERQKLGLDGSDQVLFFVGVLDEAHYFKGVDFLLAAVARLAATWPRLKLLVVGGGSKKSYYQKLAEDLKIGDRVKWLGLVNQDILPTYYRLADIFVLPSIATEAFPVVALEAMASGLPVVTTTLPGPSNLVAEAGLCVPPRDAIKLAEAIDDLLADKEKRQLLSQNGLLRVRNNFTWGQVIAKLDHLYQELIG